MNNKQILTKITSVFLAMAMVFTIIPAIIPVITAAPAMDCPNGCGGIIGGQNPHYMLCHRCYDCVNCGTTATFFKFKTRPNFIAPIEIIQDKSGWIAISSPLELKSIANNLNGKYYLTRDIHLPVEEVGEWSSIGNGDFPFTGVLDGQGYVIRNLTKNHGNGGLFGEIDGAIIRNIGLENTNINIINQYSSRVYVGAVAGFVSGSLISNVYNTGFVSLNTPDADYAIAGGIVGVVDDFYATTTTSIEYSYNKADVYSSYAAGGIVGDYFGGGSVKGCFNTGDITSVYIAGGIAGHVEGALTVEQCFNQGPISADYAAAGIVASLDNPGHRISNSYNIGSISINNPLNQIVRPCGIFSVEDEEVAVNDVYNAGKLFHLEKPLDGKWHIDDVDLDDFCFDEVWAYIDGVNKGMPVLQVFEKMYAPDPKPQFKTLPNFIAPIEILSEADKSGWIAVSTREELEAIADNLDRNFYLTNDIDLAKEEWKPIERFSGIFDGQGYVIRYMTIKRETLTPEHLGHIGLFKRLCGGTVRNLGLEGTDIDVYVTGGFGVGGIVGYGCDDCGRNYIDNCYNTGNVFANGLAYVGGIIGEAERTTITNSYNTAVLHGGEYGGGIVGFSFEATIENCFNTGNILGNAVAGGIIGEGFITTIKNCFNTGDISSNFITGGIVGETFKVTIHNSYNAGDLASETLLGGIAGTDSDDTGLFENCYWDENTASKGIGNSENEQGLTSLTTEQMQLKSSFVGFDFDKVWTIIDDINNGMPILRGSEWIFGINPRCNGCNLDAAEVVCRICGWLWCTHPQCKCSCSPCDCGCCDECEPCGLETCDKCNPPCDCGCCEECGPCGLDACPDCGQPSFTLGLVTKKSQEDGKPRVADALEILKEIVGMKPNYATDNPAAWITPASIKDKKPAVRDALEILKEIVGMDGILKPIFRPSVTY